MTCASTLQDALVTALGDTLTDQADVLRLTRTPDSSGGTTETWDSQGEVACRVNPTGGGELIVADRMGLVDTYTVTVPWAASILVWDRLVIDGTTYHVQYVPQANSARLARRLVATVIE